jgi:hypothetical protein
MPGVQCTRSLACERLEAHELVTTGSPDNSGIPCTMVLTVSFVLSSVTGLSCHRHWWNRRRVGPARADIAIPPT